jgi:hypothetical protein
VTTRQGVFVDNNEEEEPAMTYEKEHPKWEFDAIEFIRDEFLQVGVSMPRLGGDQSLWIAVYAIVYGMNEICLLLNDRVELVLGFNDGSLSYQIDCRDDRSLPYYQKVLETVGAGDIDSVLNGAALPEGCELLDIDHEKNIRIIMCLSDGHEDLVDELMSIAVDDYRGGEHFMPPETPKEGITISKLCSGSVD